MAVRLDHLRRIAFWLDEGFRVPGTRVRIGVDPILGLIPGVGDAAGAVLSAVILIEASRCGVSRFTLVRMAGNIALDTGLGVVPLLGDLFDAGWKANTRNLALLERHLATPAKARGADRLTILLLGGLLALLSVALAVGGAFLTISLFRWLLS